MKKSYIIYISVLAAGILLAVLLMGTGKLSVSNAAGAEGEIVYLEVSLEKPVRGDSMGIEYTYDSSLLELQPEKCQWKVEGDLADFSLAKPQGVWASEDPVELNGTICILAFRIRPDAEFEETTVKCTISVRNGQTQERSYSASGKIERS